MDVSKTVTLNDGTVMPTVALGVWQSGADTKQAVLAALKNGYTHIDTAAAYHNEEQVGEAIKESGVDRDSLFVTTKLWNTDIRSGRVREALEESLQKLQLDYVDLYLLHWPTENRIEAYRECEKLQQEGKIRSIGVCNFRKHHLEELIAHVNVVPAIDQVEFNPQVQDYEVLDYCREKNIVLEAWSPLGSGACLNDPTIGKLAQKYHKSNAQIILRWLLQKGIVVLPKSVHENRIIENKDIYDFAISDEDAELIDALNRMQRTGPDPDHFDF